MAQNSEADRPSVARLSQGHRSTLSSTEGGLTHLYPESGGSNNDQLVDIVAVHGLCKDPESAWVSDGVNWLQDRNMLPHVVPNTAIASFSYDPAVLEGDALEESLSGVADKLLESLRLTRHNHPRRPIVFIGHGLGGSIIEKALVSSSIGRSGRSDISSLTAGIVFLGTPHRWPRRKLPVVSTITPIIREEEARGAFTELVDDFVILVNKASIPLICYYSAHADTTVDEISARIDGFRSRSLSCDHPNLNKFAKPEDPNYVDVSGVVAKYVSKAALQSKSYSGATPAGLSAEQGDGCVRELIVTDPSHRLEELVSMLYEGTGTWILSNTKFTEWLNDEKSRLLWLHGNPGTGKTMLTTFVIQQLILKIDHQMSPADTIIAYFFVSYGDKNQSNAASILKALLWQILRRRPDLSNFLQGKHESLSDLGVLWGVFQDTLKHSSLQTAYFVVDALDECDDSLEELLSLLEPYTTAGTEQSYPTIKWFIASRSDYNIAQALDGSLEISMERDSDPDVDIRRYVERRVESLGYTHRLKNIARQIVVRKAEGTFLWAALACSELRDVPESRVEDVLSGLPGELTSVYDRIIEGITDKHYPTPLATDILRAAVVSFRPLSLGELKVVANLQGSATSGSMTLEDYAAACGPLVVVRNGAVCLIHPSLKDHLLTSSSARKAIFPSGLEDVNEAVAIRCFDHVCQVQADAGPYLDYPIAFWMEHGRESGPDVADKLDLSQEFFQTSSKLRKAWFDAYWSIRHRGKTKPNNFTLIHTAAEAGFLQLAEKLLDHGHEADVNAKDSSENRPLHWAAKNGYEAVAQLLLRGGAYIDARGENEMTALNWAAAGGHIAVVELLIKQQADINLATSDGSTALHNAVRKRHKTIVQLLLNQGVSTEARDSVGKTALNLAEDSEYEDIVGLLLAYEQMRLSKALPPDCRLIDGGFSGAIVDFSSSYHVTKRVSIDRLLSRESIDSIMLSEREVEGIAFDRVHKGSRTLRWLHLPANNILIDKHYKALGKNDAAAAVLRTELWTGRQHQVRDGSIVHARFIRPVCNNVSSSLRRKKEGDPQTHTGSKDIMLVMPFLHWATNSERQKLNNALAAIKKARSSKFKPDRRAISKKLDKDEKLLWAYLYDDHPLHIRRTLDQYYYCTLENTDARDESQTVSRYYDEYFRGSEKVVLMVDQLWLWVLAPDTVITSFPQRWIKRDRGDVDPYNMTDILNNVLQRLELIDSHIRDGYELAELIANECSGMCFDTATYRNEKLQFREFYEYSIGNVTHKESVLFNHFCYSLKKANVVGDYHDTPQETEMLSQMNDFFGETHSDNEPFGIKLETDLLKEIKDIRDELNMISMVFHDQANVWNEMPHITNNKYELRLTISGRIGDVLSMDRHAERVHLALKDLLDLKQKQANIAEAHSQRLQTEESGRQGKAILMFTIVTIVFLPLSFMASFFALQITEFPELTLSYVSKIMFPITAVVAIPCVYLALKLDSVMRLYQSRKEKVVQEVDKLKIKRKRGRDEEEGTEGEGSVEGWGTVEQTPNTVAMAAMPAASRTERRRRWTWM